MEVEVLKEQLQEMEVKSARLEKEIGLLKAKEQESGQHLCKGTPAMGKNQAQPTGQQKSSENSASIIGKEIHPEHNPRTESATPPPHLSLAKNTPKQNYASVAASKSSQAPEHPWTQVVYKNCKTNSHQSTKSNAKIEHQGRRILFPQEVSGQQMSEADIMLALNEALQKAGKRLDTRFCQVRYAPSGAISALLTEKGNAGLLIPRLSNLLIRAAKTVDPTVVRAEVLEHWQRLKVHGISQKRYLGAGKMELLKREVESSTGIELKAHPRWLISGNWLQEQQESGNKRGSAIVITVKGEAEAKKLCASGLRFGGLVKVVEKYWKAGRSSVCMTCCGIGHEWMRDYGDWPAKCVICAGPHKIGEHQYGVVGCRKGNGKICAHVTVIYANCEGNHTANSPRCESRHKANVEAQKRKKLRQSSEKQKEKIRRETGEEGRGKKVRSRTQAWILKISNGPRQKKDLKGPKIRHWIFISMIAWTSPKITNVNNTTKLWKKV